MSIMSGNSNTIWNYIINIANLICANWNKLYFHTEIDKDYGNTRMCLYIVNGNELINAYQFLKNGDNARQLETYWDELLHLIFSLSNNGINKDYLWNIMNVIVDDSLGIKISFRYGNFNQKYDLEEVLKWEYLTLGLNDNLWILDDKERNELLKQPLGNPFVNRK